MHIVHRELSDIKTDKHMRLTMYSPQETTKIAKDNQRFLNLIYTHWSLIHNGDYLFSITRANVYDLMRNNLTNNINYHRQRLDKIMKHSIKLKQEIVTKLKSEIKHIERLI